MTVRDRCPDCGYLTSMHFRAGGIRGGEYLGCPRNLRSAITEQERAPRITIRVSKRGEHKDHIIVAWADYRDAAEDTILLWDLDTGEQWMEDQRKHHLNSRRAPHEKALNAKEAVEYEVGGPVVLVFAARTKGG